MVNPCCVPRYVCELYVLSIINIKGSYLPWGSSQTDIKTHVVCGRKHFKLRDEEGEPHTCHLCNCLNLNIRLVKSETERPYILQVGCFPITVGAWNVWSSDHKCIQGIINGADPAQYASLWTWHTDCVCPCAVLELMPGWHSSTAPGLPLRYYLIAPWAMLGLPRLHVRGYNNQDGMLGTYQSCVSIYQLTVGSLNTSARSMSAGRPHCPPCRRVCVWLTYHMRNTLTCHWRSIYSIWLHLNNHTPRKHINKIWYSLISIHAAGLHAWRKGDLAACSRWPGRLGGPQYLLHAPLIIPDPSRRMAKPVGGGRVHNIVIEKLSLWGRCKMMGSSGGSYMWQ